MSDPLDRVRAAALELPETEERLSHGQPTFFVAGKQFAQFRDNHHGDGKTVVCVKTSSLDEQAMLLESDPATYSKPAYLGPSGWVSINLAGPDVDWDHVADRIAQSWELAASRGLLEAGGR
ncbi:MAG: MmcQ/YjbR family DNA-binding protein [Sphingomicrobium sp.]